jgi:hypothetical protein
VANNLFSSKVSNYRSGLAKRRDMQPDCRVSGVSNRYNFQGQIQGGVQEVRPLPLLEKIPIPE